MRKVRSAPDLPAFEHKRSASLPARARPAQLPSHALGKSLSYESLQHASKGRRCQLGQSYSQPSNRLAACQPVRALGLGLDYHLVDSVVRGADELLMESAWSKGLPAAECFELYGEAIDSAPPLADIVDQSAVTKAAASAKDGRQPPAQHQTNTAGTSDLRTVGTVADLETAAAKERALADKDINVVTSAKKAIQQAKRAKQRPRETPEELVERRQKLAACLALPVAPDRNQGEEIQESVRRSANLAEIDIQLRYTREVQQDLKLQLMADEMEESLHNGGLVRPQRRKRRRALALDLAAPPLVELEPLLLEALEPPAPPVLPPSPQTQCAMASLSFDDDINKILVDVDALEHPDGHRFTLQLPDDEALFSIDDVDEPIAAAPAEQGTAATEPNEIPNESATADASLYNGGAEPAVANNINPMSRRLSRLLKTPAKQAAVLASVPENK